MSGQIHPPRCPQYSLNRRPRQPEIRRVIDGRYDRICAPNDLWEAAGSGRRRTEGLPAAGEVRGGGVRASSGAGRPVGVRRSCGLPFRARPLPCGPKRCDRNGQARGSTRSRCRASLALLGRCLSRSRGERTRRNWRRTLWTSLSDAMEFAKRLERWMVAPPELARTMRYLTGGAKRTQRCRRSAMPWSIRRPPRRRPCSGLQCCASLFCASPYGSSSVAAPTPHCDARPPDGRPFWRRRRLGPSCDPVPASRARAWIAFSRFDLPPQSDHLAR